LWQISSAKYPQGQTTAIKDKTVVPVNIHPEKDTAHPAWKLLLNKTYQQPHFRPNMLPANIFFILHVGTRPHAGVDLGKA